MTVQCPRCLVLAYSCEVYDLLSFFWWGGGGGERGLFVSEGQELFGLVFEPSLTVQYDLIARCTRTTDWCKVYEVILVHSCWVVVLCRNPPTHTTFPLGCKALCMLPNTPTPNSHFLPVPAPFELTLSVPRYRKSLTGVIPLLTVLRNLSVLVSSRNCLMLLLLLLFCFVCLFVVLFVCLLLLLCVCVFWFLVCFGGFQESP